MGKATVYCETCGEVIPEDDFNKGRAVRYQEKDYCAKCKQEISHLLKPTEDADALARRTSRIRTVDPTSASGVRKSSGVRSQSGVRRTAQAPAVSTTPARGTPHVPSGNGHRDHPSQLRGPVASPASAPAGEKKMYVIAGAAVLLVVIILVVASMSKKSEENTDAEKRALRDKNAREAYESCLAYCTNVPQDFVGQLASIAAARDAVSGTDWEVKLAQLQKQAEETKRTKEKRDGVVSKMDELRSRIGQEPKAANEIKGKLEALRSEFPDDKELQERISQYIEEARRAAFQNDFDEVNQFVQTNPLDYEGAIKKYGDLRTGLDAFPQDYQSQMLPQVDDRLRWVKEARENDAASRWTSIRGSAEAAASQKDFFEAKRQVRNFLENSDYSMCKVMDEAKRFLQEIERDEQAWKEEQQKQPPPDPGPGPGPGPEPAAGTVTLFDGVNMPGLRRGTSATWEIANGELRAKHNEATPPAGNQINISDLVEFSQSAAEKCVFEFDAKVVKHGFGLFMGLRAQGGEGKWTVGSIISNPSVFAPDAWHHFRVEYDGSSVALTVDGGGSERLDLKDPGRGVCALGVYPGAEAHFKNITLTIK